MLQETSKLLHEFLKNDGIIDRTKNSGVWDYTNNSKVMDELSILGEELFFEIMPAGDRFYLIPTQDNDIFLKNNVDFRKDIKADKDIRLIDLYLLNYLAIYILYLFFRGKENNLRVLDFILKDELLKEFTSHCEEAVVKGDSVEGTEEFSPEFIKLANAWLQKREGNINEPKEGKDTKVGTLDRALRKLKADNLFIEIDKRIEPTRKLKDLMPYVLRKDRVKLINNWLENMEESNATD